MEKDDRGRRQSLRVVLAILNPVTTEFQILQFRDLPISVFLYAYVERVHTE